MSSGTAKRWFVPDREWKAINEDYALVNVSSTAARKAFDEIDNREREVLVSYSDKPPSFYDFRDHLMMRKALFLNFNLVYADVDDTRHEHRQMVIDQAISEVTGERQRAETVAVRHQMMEALLKNWKWKPDMGGHAIYKDRASGILEEVHHSGILERQLVEFLLSLESPHDQDSLLYHLTGQSCRTHKRRVMFLLGLIDTEQTTAMGVTEGYAMALDLAGDRLIIKSFHSDKDTHPLTGILRTETGKDDIEYNGSCFHFAKRFAEHYKEEFVDQRRGFELLVHDHVIRFFILHWDGLFKDRSRALGYPQDYIDNLEKDVERAYYIVIDLLKRIKFPVIGKLEKPL